MSGVRIRAAIEKAEKLIREQPEKARAKNTPATASLVAGLKCHVTGPASESVRTDLPPGVGGRISAGLDTLRVKVVVSAPGTPAAELGELARIACERSPVRCTDTATAQVEVEVV